MRTTPSSPGQSFTRLVIKQLIQVTSYFLIIALALFIPAGHLGWLDAWLYLLFHYLIAFISAIWMVRLNPELARERNRPGENVKRWDQVIVALNLFLTLGLYIVTSLDAGRFNWSNVPGFLRLLSLLGFIPAFGLPLGAARANAFLSSRVRIQDDRGHQVVDGGPYRFVRHPMYLGMIFFDLSLPLLLGSWWGLLVGGVMVFVIFVRTALEDSTLQAELPGYAEYAGRVRCRLIPGIW
jgi:protein-S-isoprenylcysteine O-methyltransferase Ste14